MGEWANERICGFANQRMGAGTHGRAPLLWECGGSTPLWEGGNDATFHRGFGYNGDNIPLRSEHTAMVFCPAFQPCCARCRGAR